MFPALLGGILLGGCATFTRTPVDTLPAPELLRGRPVALLDVAVALPTFPDNAERRLLSLPNEVLVKDGDRWIITPQQDMLPVSDVLSAILRSMGIDLQRQPSLYSARVARAQIALLPVLRRSEVRLSVPLVLLHGTVTEAEAEIQLTVLDVRTGRPLWTGPLKATVQISPTIQLPFRQAGMISMLRGPHALAESTATTAASEGTVQSARALLAQAYYSLAVQIVGVLNDIAKDAP